MDRLAQLEAKKMMKELEFLSSELDWKSELILEADKGFIGKVNEFLDENPDLKREFQSRMDSRASESIRRAEQDLPPPSESADPPASRQPNPKMKRAYREIVKMTHPDKVSDRRLNDMYVEAARLYGDDDLFSIYSICDRLGLDFEVGDDDMEALRIRLEEVRSKIRMIESARTWVWQNVEDEHVRARIVVSYVLEQIR